MLRESFGEYRAPTGVGQAPRNDTVGLDDLRAEVDRVSRKLGRRVKFVVGKPGLDGHSNGAEQIAVRARDAGIDVVYEGIRLTPAEIVATRAEFTEQEIYAAMAAAGIPDPIADRKLARYDGGRVGTWQKSCRPLALLARPANGGTARGLDRPGRSPTPSP